jgi:hypothetical protein
MRGRHLIAATLGQPGRCLKFAEATGLTRTVKEVSVQQMDGPVRGREHNFRHMDVSSGHPSIG